MTDYQDAESCFEKIYHLLQSWIAPLGNQLPPVYLVGGAIRDCLLKRSCRDIDLVSPDADPLAGQIATENNAHMVRFDKRQGEVNFRIISRTDPEQVIDISRMHGKDIIEDLKCRDFTINAMAIQYFRRAFGEIIDPLGGQSDLLNKNIRMVCPDSFVRDPLRILRAFRLAASLDFTIDTATCNFMEKQAHMLTNVSAERIVEELFRLFITSKSAKYVRLMDDPGILEVIFPEIEAMKGCEQNSFHHKDVWGHSLSVFENCEYIVNHLEDFFGHMGNRVAKTLNSGNRVPLLKLAALLHDVGKPATRGLKEDTGRITFYGHDREGKEIVSDIARRLKMSKKDREFFQSMVAEHLHVLNLSRPEVKTKTKIRLFRMLKDDAICLIILGMADIKGTLGPDSSKELRNIHLSWSKSSVINYYEKIKKELERKDFITGKDLIAMGMKPGPEMGQLLKKILDAQDEGIVKNRDGALSFVKRYLMEDTWKS